MFIKDDLRKRIYLGFNVDVPYGVILGWVAFFVIKKASYVNLTTGEPNQLSNRSVSKTANLLHMHF